MSESSPPSHNRYHDTTADIRLVFLPGLHGTAELFDNLLTQLQSQKQILKVNFHTLCVSYPTHISQSYQSLFNWLSEHLTLDNHSGSQSIIIAESFSSPLAIRLADKFPQTIKGIVIAGGFCSSPFHSHFSLLPLRLLFMMPPPSRIIQYFLTGPHCSTHLMNQILTILKKVSSKNLTERVRSILLLAEKPLPTIPNTPTLLLQAESDNLISWDTQNILQQHLPHSISHWLPTDHLLLQLSPESSVSHIITFINQLHKPSISSS